MNVSCARHGWLHILDGACAIPLIIDTSNDWEAQYSSLSSIDLIEKWGSCRMQWLIANETENQDL